MPSPDAVLVQTIGGPTAVIELGGLRIVTDPTFDPPQRYEAPGAASLGKTRGPAVPAGAIGPIGLALVSHDHHPDNLDAAGHELLRSIPLVLTTVAGAERLGGTARGLEPFEAAEVELPGGGRLTVTALPAQHGPDGTDHLTGPVIGFHLAGDGLPSVYVSGDNASLDVVRQIVDRLGPPDVAVLFAGAVRIDGLFDGALLTLDNAGAAEAARILGARVVVPVHHDGWEHFTEGIDGLVEAFAQAGLSDRLRVVEPGAAAEQIWPT
jgi:L-ascorbate metabolism protein UlaG (beta-lactamase superfamily)